MYIKDIQNAIDIYMIPTDDNNCLLDPVAFMKRFPDKDSFMERFSVGQFQDSKGQGSLKKAINGNIGENDDMHLHIK